MTFRELVGEAIGEASMCWEPRPAGMFESDRASKLIDRICEAVTQQADMTFQEHAKFVEGAADERLERSIDDLGARTRESTAATILAALIQVASTRVGTTTRKDVVEVAVAWADALRAELERTR